MLGIIFVILLARNIGHLAEDRGKTKWHFWLATVAAWYGGQLLVGMIAGAIIAIGWGEAVLNDMLEMMGFNLILSIVGGLSGYYILYRIVKNMPVQENPEDLINQIGIADETKEDQDTSIF